jgi:hypothetical protein
MSDMAWTGNLSSAVNGVPANEAGVIYRITTVPEPGYWIVITVSGLLAFGVRARRQANPSLRRFQMRREQDSSPEPSLTQMTGKPYAR